MRRSSVGLACTLAAVVAGGWTLFACTSSATILSVTGPTAPVTADGRSGAIIQAKVTQGSDPVQSGSVSFKSISDGVSFSQIDDPTIAPTGPISADVEVTAGVAAVKLYSIRKGSIVVTVSFVNPQTTEAVSKDISIVFGGSDVKIASFKFVSAEPPIIGLQGSGNQETSVVTFQALDANNAACPEGLSVEFSVSKDIATLQPPTGKTNSAGRVSTTVKSGTGVGSVKVVVKSADGSVSAESDSITIAGGIADWDNFDLTCNRRAIGGFGDLEAGLRMLCQAHVADRDGLKIAGVKVGFLAEAGSLAKDVTTDEQGVATNTYKTQAPFPQDVRPASAAEYKKLMPDWMQTELDSGVEPSWPCNHVIQTGTGTNWTYAECNPRDGVVTIIAYTVGEEAYEDANNNGQYDSGEGFVDLPEPYVDSNDNGQYDEGELYSDVNGNKSWDGPNGKWDRNTVIWKATKIVWTGEPNSSATGTGYYAGSSRLSGVTVPHCGRSGVIDIEIFDRNFNKPAQEFGEGVECNAKAGGFVFLRGGSGATSNLYYGHRVIHSIEIGDAHSCAPDCRADGSCGVVQDTLNCIVRFTAAQDAEDGANIFTYNGGGDIAVTVE